MLSLVALGLLAGQAAASIATISTKGSKFFTSDGNQFYLKGTLISANQKLRAAVIAVHLRILSQALPTNSPQTTRSSRPSNASAMPH